MHKIKRYETLPVIIDAVHLNEDNIEFLKDWADIKVNDNKYYVFTLEGVMEAQLGDYIIKGLRGEFYPCKYDVFHKKYQEIKE